MVYPGKQSIIERIEFFLSGTLVSRESPVTRARALQAFRPVFLVSVKSGAPWHHLSVGTICGGERPFPSYSH